MDYHAHIKTNTKNIFSSVPDGSEALILKDIAENSDNGVVHICKNNLYIDRIENILAVIAPDCEILTLPAWDTNPYDNTSPSNNVISARLKTFSQIKNGLKKNQILLTSANAIIKRNIPKSIIAESTLRLNVGLDIQRDVITDFLVKNSYSNVGAASDSGEFSLRGSIIDIFPPNEEFGIRVDFFGNEIESIRTYDPLTQISSGHINEFNLIPASELLLSAENIANFKESFISEFGLKASSNAPIFESISDGRKFPGMENFLPIFYQQTDSIFTYCKDAIFSFEHDVENVLIKRWEQINDAYETRNIFLKNEKNHNTGNAGTLILAPEKLFLMEEEFTQTCNNGNILKFNKFLDVKLANHKVIEANFTQGDNYFLEGKTQNLSPFEVLKQDLSQKFITDNKTAKNTRNKTKNFIACMSFGSRERMANLLSEHDINNVLIDDFTKEYGAVTKNNIGLIIMPLEHGFEGDNIKFISESDLLGERVYRKSSRKGKKAEDFLKEAANMNGGELVVHKEHGIGRFEGLETLEIQGIAHDFITLIYRDGDKFYVPVENIEMISRYGSEEGVELDKLGGLGWQERTAKIKKRIREIAKDLINIAANREIESAQSFELEQNKYDEFISKFPYAETDDQLNAIDDVINDLKSGKAMDRLVCGDVGFGKTEVAIRAAFAVTHKNNESSKEQVALICPTTLLCRQHFKNLKERFAHTGLKVKQLSRMVSPKEIRKTKEEISNGDVDIIVATHALLAKDIEFFNLSLLIIDEEQRFGVKQKEQLKKLKNETHVLTLSATPIPRTLQLSLSGIRDLSLITTPPVDRLAVRTFVMPFDSITIREAILKEHYRGGRSYYVAPRIKDLDELEPKLKSLIPEVRIVKAHGQMKPEELDDIMNDFYEGKFDVLLSTTIVESGLDVPSANTIILHRTDMFGLAQLYQLRGRVGRGKIRGYAYLTTPTRKILSKPAEKRLEVMQKLDTLGAGFTLASYDMDIRGFGNLLGDEQSGNVKEVGVELYQNMLKEAVEGLKALNDNSKGLKYASNNNFSVKINLGIAVLIPDNYIEDSDLRMGLYRRLGNLENDQDVESYASELADRFGTLPKEVDNLLDTVKIKFLCKQLHINKIDAGNVGAKIQFFNDNFENPEALISFIAKNPIKYKIKEGNKLVIANCDWKNANDRILELKQHLNNILEYTQNYGEN